MSERLIPVRSFGELRAGMICVGGPCSCGSKHRFMLLAPNNKPTGSWSDGGEIVEDSTTETVFPATPTPGCFPANRTPVVTSDHVARGKIWRVVDGLEDPGEYTATVQSLEDFALVPKVKVRPR